jgi:hypothetical protein
MNKGTKLTISGTLLMGVSLPMIGITNSGFAVFAFIFAFVMTAWGLVKLELEE